MSRQTSIAEWAAAPEAPSEKAESAGARNLRIGGLTPLTSIDFPGRLAAVVFCQGCPWRCSYCHNPELLDATAHGAVPWSQVRAFLQRRRGLLDGVVFSGGEPTLQAALSHAVADTRSLGFETALHTGGMYPERLAALLPQLDWVGLDIKGPWRRIDAITGARDGAARIQASLNNLLGSGVAYECRTTWHPGLFGLDELRAMAEELSARGVKHWSVQECRMPGGVPHALGPEDVRAFSARFKQFTLRRV